jgi:hypothetical protein
MRSIRDEQKDWLELRDRLAQFQLDHLRRGQEFFGRGAINISPDVLRALGAAVAMAEVAAAPLWRHLHPRGHRPKFFEFLAMIWSRQALPVGSVQLHRMGDIRSSADGHHTRSDRRAG